MDRCDTRPPGVLSPRGWARWLLLCAVIAGVFGLHILTGDHGSHRDVHTISAADAALEQDQPRAAVADELTRPDITLPSAHPATPLDDSDNWLTGCLLFLATSGLGAGLLLALSRFRSGIAGHAAAPPDRLGQVRIGFQPPAPPPVALGVLRT